MLIWHYLKKEEAVSAGVRWGATLAIYCEAANATK